MQTSRHIYFTLWIKAAGLRNQNPFIHLHLTRKIAVYLIQNTSKKTDLQVISCNILCVKTETKLKPVYLHIAFVATEKIQSFMSMLFECKPFSKAGGNFIFFSHLHSFTEFQIQLYTDKKIFNLILI